jgi:hypothetical protein
MYLCWLALLGMLVCMILALVGASAQEATDADGASARRLAPAASR